MTVDMSAPRDVEAILNYHLALNDAPPYNYNIMVTLPGVLKTNVGKDPRTMLIHDARGKEDEFKLDVCGFQFISCPSIEKDFLDQERIQTVYYAECTEILKAYAGVKRVFIFNHTLRRTCGDPASGVRFPSRRVHVDQTPTATMDRVRYHMGEDAERLLKGRYAIIILWRPIGHPVIDTPLTLADYRSVDPDRDLVSTHLVDVHREGSFYTVKHNPAHKWYYLSRQTPDEIVLHTSFDSDVTRARLVPHTSFRDRNCPVGAPERQSIEIRALVFDTE